MVKNIVSPRMVVLVIRLTPLFLVGPIILALSKLESLTLR